MHKFPALNPNKNANETLWVLIMQRTTFLLFTGETFEGRFQAVTAAACLDASGFATTRPLDTFKNLKRL